MSEVEKSAGKEQGGGNIKQGSKGKVESKLKLPMYPPQDYCNKYRPLFDKNTFLQEMQHTEGQLLHYAPYDIRQQFKQFTTTTYLITGGTALLSLSFVLGAHKISIIKRVLGQKSWGMFGLKLLTVAGGFGVIGTVVPQVEQQEGKWLYQALGIKYRNYKLSGDILQLGGNTVLQGQGLSMQEAKQL